MFSWTTVAISLLAIIQLVVAIPTWEGHASRSAMGSLVPGATEIVALGPHRNKRSPMNNYLSVGGALGEFDHSLPMHMYILTKHAGEPGNAVITRNSPLQFFISRNQLYQYTNDSYILPVHVVNSSTTADVPLQLVTGNKVKSAASGIWRWKGVELHYEEASVSNHGIFYACQDKTGERGVFMFLGQQ